MLSATASFIAAALKSGVEPIWLVELPGLYQFLSTVDPNHTATKWRFGDGLIFGAGATFGGLRPEADVRLAPDGRAVSGIRHELTLTSNTTRLAGTQVDILNQDGYSAVLEGLGLDDTRVRVLLGFQGLLYSDYLLLMTGRLENYSTTWDSLRLDVTDARFSSHRDLSARLGSPYFPGTPVANRDRAIPILIGRNPGTSAIQIEGDAAGSLAFGINTAATSIWLTETDAPFPESGDVHIDTEFFVAYQGRRYVVVQGKTYLELYGLTRTSPLIHSSGTSVTLVNVQYRYLVGYQMAAITAVYDNGVLQPAINYTLELAASGADYPVTIVSFPSLPTGPVTVDAEAIDPNAIANITNGDFETGDLTGWTAGTALSTVTSPGNTGDYKVEVEGGNDVWANLHTDFATNPGELYSLLLTYRDTIPNAGLLTNGFFDTGDTTGWTLVDDPVYFGAVVDVAPIGLNNAAAIRFQKGPGPYGAGFSGGALNEYRYSFYQDVTTIAGENYQLSFTALNDLFLAFPYFAVQSPGYKLGTPGDDTAYGEAIYGGQLNKGWQTFTINFVPTTTTTRVTLTVLSQSSNDAIITAIANIVLIKPDTPETSYTRIGIGNASDPVATLDNELPTTYGWTTLSLPFTATDSTTRLSLSTPNGSDQSPRRNSMISASRTAAATRLK